MKHIWMLRELNWASSGWILVTEITPQAEKMKLMTIDNPLYQKKSKEFRKISKKVSFLIQNGNKTNFFLYFINRHFLEYRESFWQWVNHL